MYKRIFWGAISWAIVLQKNDQVWRKWLKSNFNSHVPLPHWTLEGDRLEGKIKTCYGINGNKVFYSQLLA